MSRKVVVYGLGIPLTFIWLFVAITGMTWIIWGIACIALVAFCAAIVYVVQDQTTSSGSFNQYIQRHNAEAAREKARMQLNGESLIEESDD